jgi:phosphotriesterase-related protein
MTAVDASIQTVLGPVPADSIGAASIHEHVFIDLECWFDDPTDEATAVLAREPVRPEIMPAVRANPFGVHDNLHLDDEAVAVDELRVFRRAGGGTIVDLTLPEIGRNPGALVRVARATGINVVMGCGHYIARAHPPGLVDRGAELLVEEMCSDLIDGVEVEGVGRVRAGVIGEIGTSDPLEPDEQIVLEAACAAQHATGRGLIIHLDPWGSNGHEVLDVCETLGVPLDRIVLSHMDPSLVHHHEGAPETAYMRSLARRGCWVAIDICGDEDAYGGRAMPSDEQRVAAVVSAHEDGWASHLLLAQDVCLKTQLHAYGGRGYDHLLTGIAPALRHAGLGENDVRALLVEHPRRVLAGTGSGSPGTDGGIE